MAQVETVSLPHLPEHPVHIALFRDVKNSLFLRQQLLAGNADFEYAFLDASVVLSRMHLLAACFRGINDLASNRLKSRNVHSEIVFSFSPNNNIAESFRRFGISDITQHVLAVKVGGPSSGVSAESVGPHLKHNIEGQQVDVSDDTLAELVDLQRLRKVYKLNSPPKKGAANGTPPQAAELKDLETFVIGAMALKGS